MPTGWQKNVRKSEGKTAISRRASRGGGSGSSGSVSLGKARALAGLGFKTGSRGRKCVDGTDSTLRFPSSCPRSRSVPRSTTSSKTAWKAGRSPRQTFPGPDRLPSVGAPGAVTSGPCTLDDTESGSAGQKGRRSASQVQRLSHINDAVSPRQIDETPSLLHWKAQHDLTISAIDKAAGLSTTAAAADDSPALGTWTHIELAVDGTPKDASAEDTLSLRSLSTIEEEDDSVTCSVASLAESTPPPTSAGKARTAAWLRLQRRACEETPSFAGILKEQGEQSTRGEQSHTLQHPSSTSPSLGAAQGPEEAVPELPNERVVMDLVVMGFERELCQRASLASGNESTEAAASWLLECATDRHEDCDREKSSCASTDHTGHEGEDVNAEEIWPQPLGATISDFVVASEQRRLLTALTEQNE